MTKEKLDLAIIGATVLGLRFLPIFLSEFKIPGSDIFSRGEFIKEILAGQVVNHPPLYYHVVAEIHSITGFPILSLNTFLGYLFSIIPPFVAYYMGKELFDRRAGLIASLSLLTLSSGIYLEFNVFQINNLINAFVLIPLVLLAFQRTQRENFKKYNYIFVFVGSILICLIHGLTAFTLLGVIMGIGVLLLLPLPFIEFLDYRNTNWLGYFILLLGIIVGLGMMWGVYTADRVDLIQDSIEQKTPDIQFNSDSNKSDSIRNKPNNNIGNFQNRIGGLVQFFIDSPFSILISFNKFTSGVLFVFGGFGMLYYLLCKGYDSVFIIFGSWIISLCALMVIGLEITSISFLRFIKDISFPLSMITGFLFSDLWDRNWNYDSKIVVILIMLTIISGLFHVGQQIQPDDNTYEPIPEREEAIEFLKDESNVTKVLPTRDSSVLDYHIEDDVLFFRKIDSIKTRKLPDWIWEHRKKQGYIFSNPSSEKSIEYLDEMEISHIYIRKNQPFAPDYIIDSVGEFNSTYYEKKFENELIIIYSVKEVK